MKTIDLENLAVMFRTNDPNLGHVSTLDAMTDAGLAYVYGLYRDIPKAHVIKRSNMRCYIATELDRKAKNLAGPQAKNGRPECAKAPPTGPLP